MIDVMFYEAFEEEQKALKKYLPRRIKAVFTSQTIQETRAKNSPAGVISIRTQSRVPPSWRKDLDGILTRSQGYDHLTAFRPHVTCGYLGNYCSRAVAEQAILMMLGLFRKLKKQTQHLRTFTRDGLTGRECRGRNALVVGVGNIGKEIVDIAQGLRMNVRGVDIAPTRKRLKYVPLSGGVPWADVIFCALPLTTRTERMFDYDGLKKAKTGTIFINIARGEISPVKDLARLLDRGILGGIGMDVYPEEGILANSLRAGKGRRPAKEQEILALARRENVLFTPHNAFNTEEALERKASLTAEAILSYFNSQAFPCPVPRR